jgi:hypothetical protein
VDEKLVISETNFISQFATLNQEPENAREPNSEGKRVNDNNIVFVTV